MSVVNFWEIISFLGSGKLLLPVSLGLILYSLYTKKNKEAILLSVGYYGGLILNTFLKQLFRIPRPSDSLISIEGYAFPSGHALSAVIFYSWLVFFFHKKIKNRWGRIAFMIVNILLILVIGLSRLMLKVHHINDVLAGYIIGLFWLLVVYKALRKIKF